MQLPMRLDLSRPDKVRVEYLFLVAFWGLDFPSDTRIYTWSKPSLPVISLPILSKSFPHVLNDVGPPSDAHVTQYGHVDSTERFLKPNRPLVNEYPTSLAPGGHMNVRREMGQGPLEEAAVS